MKKIFHLFSRLTDSDVDWLAAHGTATTLSPGTRLIVEGSENRAVFIVLEGALVVRTEAAGQVGQVDVGEVLGEMSLVDGRGASATVESARAARVLAVPRDALERHIERDVGFSSRFFRGVAQTLSERLRAVEAKGGASDDLDELPGGTLGNLHVAGARFDRLLKSTLAPGR